MLLDEVMKDPENPTDDMISDMDIKVRTYASIISKHTNCPGWISSRSCRHLIVAGPLSYSLR